MATRIKTASISDETDLILGKIRDRGVGFSEFIRLAAKFYIDNGYRFTGVDSGQGADSTQDEGDPAI